LTIEIDKHTLEQIIIQNATDKKPGSINQLIDVIKQATSASDKEILNTIITLQNQGKLKLTRQEQPASLTEFLKTSLAFWFWTTIILTYAAVIAALTIPANLQPISYIRDALGFGFVLSTPGYTFMKALFPTNQTKADSEQLDSIERIALSISLSLALVPIIGLLLNYTPFGITLNPIVISLAAITTLLASIALIREHNIMFAQSKLDNAKK
jgi:hypothetical protein